MPVLILVFVFLLMIRDYLNETGYIKNLIGRLKTRYRLHRIRKDRKGKREEMERQAHKRQLLQDAERVMVMVSRFSGGVADMLHTLPVFYYSSVITTETPTNLDLKESEMPEETALKTLLKRAVESEDYESAGKYRDELKKLYLAPQKQSNGQDD
jgi:hypothetical protein